MKALVTYKKNSWCNEIANQLEEEFDDFHYIYAKNGNMELVNKEGEDIQEHYDSLIRFGTYANYLPRADKVYNSYEGIKTTSNKPKARKIFEDNHIPIPQTYYEREIGRILGNYDRHNELNFPIIRRKKNHFGGKGVDIANDIEELESLYYGNEGYYYSEHFPKNKEFRVHIASGKAIIVAEKVVEEDKKDNVIWNLNSNGVCEEFNTLRWSDYRDIEEVIKVASLSTKVLELDYGAVDVVAYPRHRENELPPVAVLEVNSAPRLEEYGISRYVQYFKWLFNHKNEKAEFKLPHTLDRFSFTNEDFEEEYRRLDNEVNRNNNRTLNDNNIFVEEEQQQRGEEIEEISELVGDLFSSY